MMSETVKIDLKKEYKNLYTGKHNVIQEIRVPELQYLMIDGEGDPNNKEMFEGRVSQLYGVAYTVKFMYSRADKSKDYVVPPLEGLWWCDDMRQFSTNNKGLWKWTLMILQPDFVRPEDLENAKAELQKKKKLTEMPAVRLETLEEGDCVQSLHIGSYADEAPLIKNMHDYIHEKGKRLHGLHHEIYISNPQKTPPDKLKTLIRQPCR